MTIKTYQSPDWEVITTERRKALEAVVDAAAEFIQDIGSAKAWSRLGIALAALKETEK